MPGIKNLRDKVAVITGAGSGIGRATAHALAGQGAWLMLADNNPGRLEAVVAEIRAKDVPAAGLPTDVSDKTQVAALAAATIETFGRVDILHNNAGIGWGGHLASFSLEDWETIVGVNFWSVVYGVHFFLPHLIRQRSGHIVNTASMAGFFGLAASGAYTATKHAVVGLGDVLRAEVRPYNIGVSTICPSMVKTNIVADGKIVFPESGRMSQEKVAAMFDRFGRSPDKVARAVVKAIRRDRAFVPVGVDARLMWYVKRLSQRAYQGYVRLSAVIAAR